MRNLLEKEIRSFLRAATLVLILLAVLLFYYYLFPATWNTLMKIIPLILPFVIAAIFVGILEPIISFIQQKMKFSRTIAIVSVIATLFAAILGILIWLISMFVMELLKFSNEFPRFSNMISDTIFTTIYNLQDIFTTIDIPPQLMDIIDGTISKSLDAVREISIGTLNFLFEVVTLLPMAILILVVAVIAAFFISRDKDIILKAFKNYLPPWVYNRMIIIGSETGNAVSGYIQAQVILMIITAVITFIGLQIIGNHYSFLIAALVGIADILPVLGPGAVFVPWILWEIINGKFIFAVILLILYTIVSVVRQILQPKVVGDSIGLHPLETLVSLFIGLRIAGVLGLIFCPIIWVVIKTSWKSGVFNFRE